MSTPHHCENWCFWAVQSGVEHIRVQDRASLSTAAHREAGTSAAGGIKSVPSDAQGFMGLVKIAFPTVEIKHRRMFSTQAVV